MESQGTNNRYLPLFEARLSDGTCGTVKSALEHWHRLMEGKPTPDRATVDEWMKVWAGRTSAEEQAATAVEFLKNVASVKENAEEPLKRIALLNALTVAFEQRTKELRRFCDEEKPVKDEEKTETYSLHVKLVCGHEEVLDLPHKPVDPSSFEDTFVNGIRSARLNCTTCEYFLSPPMSEHALNARLYAMIPNPFRSPQGMIDNTEVLFSDLALLRAHQARKGVSTHYIDGIIDQYWGLFLESFTEECKEKRDAQLLIAQFFNDQLQLHGALKTLARRQSS